MKEVNYIKMCEQVPKQLWNKVNHIGTLMAWRSFKGIVKPCKKRGGLKRTGRSDRGCKVRVGF